MSAGASRDVFISHSSSDVATARDIRAMLLGAGLSCWLAPDDVTGTTPWTEQIVKAIETSRVLLVLVSRRANESVHVAREVNLASGLGRPVLPVRIEQVAPTGSLAYLLTLSQRVDAFPPPMTSHRARILRVVREGLSSEVGPASAPVRPDAAAPSAAGASSGFGPDVGQLDGLVGRSRELEQILERVHTARLVSLTGPGGSGKTRLARAVAEEIGRQGGRAWFVDASTVTDGTLIPTTVAAALRVETSPAEEPIDAVSETLRGLDALLVLDNLEQIDGAVTPIAAILAAVPTVHLLATSRVPLGMPGEVEIAIQPLALPDAPDPAAIAASPAGELFLQLAGAIGRLGDLDARLASDVAALLTRLDGLPLAIELAAARTRVMTPGEILDRLDRHGLTALDRPRSDARRSLAQIIDWTRRLLDPTEAEVLEAASVCAGSDIELLELFVPDADVVSALESLVTVGMVRTAGAAAGGHTRFHLLETVRAAVQAGLSEDTRTALRDRHAMAVLGVAERRYSGDAATPEERELLDADADNVRLALDRFDDVDPVRGLALWRRVFYPLWASRARLREGMARLERTASLAPAPTVELSRALTLYAINVPWIAGPRAHRTAMLRAREVARLVGDRESELDALSTLGAVALNEGDRPLAQQVMDALDDLEERDLPPAARLRVLEARHHAAAALFGIASDEAMAPLLDGIELARTLDRPNRAITFGGTICIALLHRGEAAAAATEGARAAEVARRYGSPVLAWTLGALAMARAAAGDAPGAIDALREAIDETLARSASFQTGDTLLAAMPVLALAGQPLAAAKCWGAAHAMETSGATDIPPDDEILAQRTLDTVRSSQPAAEVEAAIAAGAQADPVELLQEVKQRLAGPPPQ